MITPAPPHHLRTITASFFGFIAINLVLASILVVWLNRTLTDTPTYVRTVAPLVTKPEIQNFIADKTTDSLLKSVPLNDVATTLLPADQVAGKTPEQLQAAVRAVVRTSVLQVVASKHFATLWKDTNQSAHADLTRQITAGDSHLTLDLSPAIVGVIDELKTTQLAPVSAKLEVKPDTGKLNLQGGSIAKARTYYGWFKSATWLIVIVTILSAVASVWLSVHHLKTLRRILVSTGLVAGFLALSLQAPALIHLSSVDVATRQATVAIAGTVFHELQLACIVISLVCLLAVLATKLYSRAHPVMISKS